jgi:serine/threonine protein kinase
VRVCWPISEPDTRKYAVKIVDTKGEVFRHAAAFISARQEASILRSVRHPHIVELIDVFEKERWLFLVMECIQGGELFSALADPRVPVTEACLGCVGRQLLQALRHLHDRSVVHRDVKAENILLLSNPAKTNSWHIKLIDFGLAMRLERSPCIFSMCTDQEVPFEELVCGTAYYCAPEVWVNDYGPKVDIWAAGVVLYLALLGTFPFYDNDADLLEAMICSTDTEPSYKPNCEKECPAYRVSVQARQCLEALLVKEEDARPSSAAALQQPWLLHSKCAQVDTASPSSAFASFRTGGALAGRQASAPALLCEARPLEAGDQIIPFAVRSKAGRAAARPPVDAAMEQSRTSALEALKARVTLRESPGCPALQKVVSSSSHASSFSWRSPPRCQSRELEMEQLCTQDAVLRWTDRDFTADTALTDSDVDESVACCH